MVLFIVIILSLYFSPIFMQPQTCVLPFVVEPCTMNGTILSCTFSVNSSEREKTCPLSNVTLIFTTSTIELFLIPQYYNQIISVDRHVISTLIIEPRIIEEPFEYDHWTDVPIQSIEIPVDTYAFVITHTRNIFDITRIQKNSNKTYWHLQTRLSHNSECERTIFFNRTITKIRQVCPYLDPHCKLSLSGPDFTHNKCPCYASGYQQTVCFIDSLSRITHSESYNSSTPYETVYINVYGTDRNVFHRIHLEKFQWDKVDHQTVYTTHRLVFLFNAGILQISPELFRQSGDLQIRIEHASCDQKTFRVDIINDTKPSIIDNLIEYPSNKHGVLACRFNFSE